MTTFSHITHHMGKLDNGMYAVKRITPIVRLGFGSEVVFLQSGNFYDASGVVYTDETLPGWVLGEMTKLSDAALADVGFKRPEAKPSPQPNVEVIIWKCPECHKEMDERNKEPHLAKHARKAQPASTEKKE